MRLRPVIALLFFSYSFLWSDGIQAVSISSDNRVSVYPGDTIKPIFSKKIQKKINSANRLYDELAYKKAIEIYNKIPNLNSSEKLKLANSYRLVNDTENAELWYREIVDQNKEPSVFLNYAQVLHSNSKEIEAAEYYQLYTSHRQEQSNWDHTTSDWTTRIGNMSRFNDANITLENQRLINTENIEYSPAFYKNGVIFVSTRNPEKPKSNAKDPWIEENFMSLFLAEMDSDNKLTSAKEFSYSLNSRYHEGPVCFANNGEVIYFTRNNYQNGERINDANGIMKLQIFSSRWNGDKWENPKQLSFNLIDYEECHPSISNDGTRLYFASNRPGGFGGMDIYVTENRYGVWTNPKNLGPKINTPGNEIFPFIHNSGVLFFSSNGWDGLGGLDILYTQKNAKGKWHESINLGQPFNSKKDDFGIIVDSRGQYGYLSSSRAGGNGKDDIYSFRLPESETEFDSPLSQLANQAKQHYSLSNFQKLPSLPLIPLKISPVVVKITTKKEITAVKEYHVDNTMIANLRSGKAFVLENLYYDFNKHFIREDASIELDKVVEVMQSYPEMIIELGSHTDTRGSASYNQQLSTRRAQAAVDYIVNKGIERKNLIASGYGESVPRNRCTNGIKCSEEEHQFNRRTEVKILKVSDDNK